jgi:hypothetical protein
MLNVSKFIFAAAALFVASSQACAADMPVKAPRQPFLTGYTNNAGFYWGVGTFTEIDQAKVTTGPLDSNLFAVGQALDFTLGYVRGNAAGTAFLAVEASCGWQNVGGTTQVVGVTVAEVRSRLSCEERLKLGGPITNLLNLLPSGGLPLPALPTLGNPSGTTHPYLFVGARENKEVATDILGNSRERWAIKGVVGAGMIQQFDTGIAADIYVEWNPEQGGFSLGGPSKANMGNGYRLGAKLLY